MASKQDPWYIAKGSDGFTHERQQAETDRNGVPLLCGGAVNQVWKAEFAKQKRLRQETIDGIWEMLYDALDPPEDDNGVKPEPVPGVASGVAKVLAFIAYGDDPTHSEETLIALANDALGDSEDD